MNTASTIYDDLVLCYCGLVRQVSPKAADVIEQIDADFGSQAALRTALIITILKTEVQTNDWIPSIDLYDDLLEDFPATMPLAKRAMTCWLRSWASSVIRATGKLVLAGT